MQKYKVTRKLKHTDGKVYDFGDIIELYAEDAKRLSQIGALDVHIDDAPSEAPKPKAKPKKRKKPATPKTLDDAALITPDTKAR